jgi:hypothetical protein
MDIAAVLEALQTLIDSDPTTTAKAAKKLSTDAGAILEPIREFTDQLCILLTEAESSASNLGDADDAEEREQTHENLVQAVSDLREHLVPDQVLAPAG